MIWDSPRSGVWPAPAADVKAGVGDSEGLALAPAKAWSYSGEAHPVRSWHLLVRLLMVQAARGKARFFRLVPVSRGRSGGLPGCTALSQTRAYSGTGPCRGHAGADAARTPRWGDSSMTTLSRADSATTLGVTSPARRRPTHKIGSRFTLRHWTTLHRPRRSEPVPRHTDRNLLVHQWELRTTVPPVARCARIRTSPGLCCHSVE